MIKFNKYHGTGNDFIMIDNREGQFSPPLSRTIEKMCDRHFGIGADGLILLEDDPDSDFRMRYFNADGKEATMCGNGGRCTVAFASKLGIIGKSCRFMAPDGYHDAIISENRINLGMADTDLPVKKGEYLYLDTGSPHLVVPVTDIGSINVMERGRELSLSALFSPKEVNVNFVEKRGDNTIKVRTFERGVEAETLSCGTGVTASAIANCYTEGEGRYSVEVITKGGDLQVEFEIDHSGAKSITLTGRAEFVFEGLLDTNHFN